MPRIIFALVVSTVIVTACGLLGTPTPTPQPTRDLFSVDPNWVYKYLTLSPPAPSAISDADFARIMDSIGTPEAATVAVELRTMDPSWLVSGPDIDQFATDVCFTDARAATSALLAKVPNAKINALAPLMQAVGLVYRTCNVNKPDVLSAASDQIVLALVQEQQRSGAAIPTPVANPVKPPSDIDKAACGAGAAVLTGLVKNYLKGLKGGIVGAAAIAGAVVYCPSLLGSALGQ